MKKFDSLYARNISNFFFKNHCSMAVTRCFLEKKYKFISKFNFLLKNLLKYLLSFCEKNIQ